MAKTTYTLPPKQYTPRQLAAQDMSRRAFAKAKELLAEKGCSVSEALKAGWVHVKTAKTNGRGRGRGKGKGRSMHSNPRYSLSFARVNPGAEVVEQGGKFHVYMNGVDTGKYYMSREKAEEKASRM